MKALLIEPSPSSGKQVSATAILLAYLLALSLVSVATLGAFAVNEYQWNWSSVFKYRFKFWDGWTTTVLISMAALILSVLVGAIAALAARGRLLPLKAIANLYIELTRGTPLLVQILIYFYVVADAVDLQNRYVAGVLILALFSGAYIAEIFRAGIQTVGKSQLLSARAIGLTGYQTFRYIVLPQALRNSLPPLAGQFANLIKDSSLLSTIALSEFTLNAQEINTNTSSAFESYFPLAIGYLMLTLPVMQLSRYIEKKVSFDT